MSRPTFAAAVRVVRSPKGSDPCAGSRWRRPVSLAPGSRAEGGHASEFPVEVRFRLKAGFEHRCGHRHIGLPQQPAGFGNAEVVDILGDVLARQAIDGAGPARPRAAPAATRSGFRLGTSAARPANDRFDRGLHDPSPPAMQLVQCLKRLPAAAARGQRRWR